MPVDAADAELVTKMLKRWAGWDRVPDEVIGQLCTIAELLDVKPTTLASRIKTLGIRLQRGSAERGAEAM